MSTTVTTARPSLRSALPLLSAQRERPLTLRSTACTLLSLLLGWCAVAGLSAYAQANAASGDATAGPSGSPPPFLGGSTSGIVDSATMTANGVVIAQLIVIVFAVLAVTAEISSGTLRLLFLSAPRRTGVLLSTAAVSAAAVLVVALTAAMASFFVARAFLSSADLDTSLSDPGQLRAVIGSALYLTVLAVFSTAFGALLRSTAAGISATVGAVLVLPLTLSFLPEGWSSSIEPWLPTSAGMAVVRPVDDAAVLGPWQGLAAFAAYSVALLAVAVVVTKKRDA